jgi:para-nitrobenzyl esterase
MRRTWASPVVAVAVAGLTALGTMPASASSTSTASTAGSGRTRGPLVAHADKGALRGVRSAGVDSFLGIRYAAPPVGSLRWSPPQPAHRWRGVLAADQYGNRCPALADR